MNLCNVFFSLGSVFFPLIVTLAATRFGLPLTLTLMALLVALPGVLSLGQTFPAGHAAGGFNWSDVAKAALDPSIIILAFVLLFYSSLETSTGGWLRTYLEQEFHASAQTSGLMLTLFFGLMMVGRLAASQVAKRIRGSLLVLGAASGAVIGLLLLALASNLWMAAAGAVICGLCYAPIFPTTAGTASTYFPRIFGTVFGMLMMMAFLGSMTLPAAIGYVAKGTTVRNGIWLICISSVLLLIVQGIFVAYERHRFLKTQPTV